MYKFTMIITILIYFALAIPLGIIAALFQEVHMIYDVLRDNMDINYYENIQSGCANVVEKLFDGIGRFFGLE